MFFKKCLHGCIASGNDNRVVRAVTKQKIK